jgi:hypothetical protein
MSWESAGKTAEKAAKNGGIFARLENDGDRIIVAFLGEPEAKEVHWIGEGTEICSGEGCKNCKRGDDPGARFSMNVYVKSRASKGEDLEEVGKVQIFEQGVRWFRDVEAVKAKYGLEKWWFEIERKGKAGSKKTKYSVLPEEKFTDEEKKMLASVELNDLSNPTSNNDDDDDDDDDDTPKKNNEKKVVPINSKSKSDGPMDADDVAEIVKKMQNQPKDQIKVFLDKFGVKRFKDLKANQKSDVFSFIKALEGEPSGTEGDEEDPFS